MIHQKVEEESILQLLLRAMTLMGVTNFINGGENDYIQVVTAVGQEIVT